MIDQLNFKFYEKVKNVQKKRKIEKFQVFDSEIIDFSRKKCRKVNIMRVQNSVPTFEENFSFSVFYKILNAISFSVILIVF
jgi:hypothetical protein